MRARKRDPFLRGKSVKHQFEDEDRILDFILHLVQLFHRTENTIKTKLKAIRYYHLTNGLQDPLETKERIWLALGDQETAGTCVPATSGHRKNAEMGRGAIP